MVATIHKTGPWNLTDLKSIPSNGYKVMSCFHCGGGSTMGYKFSGFDVLGGVEIDKSMMSVYRANHNPKYSLLMGVQDFNKLPKDKIPKEFFNLDILDGSPPCSSFSMSGSREKAWGKNKKFREGQAVQVLDDLFFHFIETARILQPKIVVAENVKGLIMGKAKGYVKQINQMFNHAGYECQLFLLNAAFMGVPQRRERTFFVARRKDLNLPKLNLKFNEKIITVKEAFNNIIDESGSPLTPFKRSFWFKAKPGELFSKYHPKGHYFNERKLSPNKPSNTLQASGGISMWTKPNYLSNNQAARLQTFPEDYNYNNIKNIYLCGMSVPPYMMNRLSKQIQLQLLDVLQ